MSLTNSTSPLPSNSQSPITSSSSLSSFNSNGSSTKLSDYMNSGVSVTVNGNVGIENTSSSPNNSKNSSDVPLSLSFLRRPSRSNSVSDLEDVEKIMKMNTLLNAKNGEAGPDDDIIKSNNLTDHTLVSSPMSFQNYDDGLGSPSESYTYFHPLVRKKSGELVKSSLKLNTLGNSKSAPTTPSYKSVHFGIDIAVKYFDQKDKPSTISAGNSPYNSDDDDDDIDQARDRDLESGRGLSMYGDYDDEDEGLTFDSIFHVARDYIRTSSDRNLSKFKRLMAPWNLDASQFPKVCYRDEIDQETPIFLERCFLNVEKTELMGHVAVKNISYTKSITLRYTYDNWKTVMNVDASYVPEIPRLLKKNSYDRFLFKISVPTLFSQFSSSPMFAIGVDPKLYH
ncbi:unnamed protein product [Ambrosiozyma monospora]|uniref:Unnamed protein product n=1 Tax=Ambrosiozyma monospora TaxID=43982 RepID=A0ACB5TD02_AMBMO|nr:unnamed protein product [Ambrosiozyma monospora]